MKKGIVGIFLLFILCACSNQKYNDGMQDLELLLEEQKFDQAEAKLSEVIEVKETEENTVTQNLLESLLYAIETESDNELASAKLLYEDILKYNNEHNYKTISIIKRYANQSHEQINSWITHEDKINESIQTAFSYAEENEYEDALTLLNELKNEKTTHPNKKELMSNVDSSIESVENNKRDYEAEQMELKKAEEERLAKLEAEKKAQEAARKKEEEEAKLKAEKEAQAEKEKEKEKEQQKESNEESTPSNLSKEQAAGYVVEYAQVPIDNPNVFVEYDHDNQHGDWVYQVYEVVIDNPETKEGHTATWGWYAVDPNTGYIYNNMQ
ncbi:hypothetical protein [Halobacillus sp. Nhm2S1]|uniref:hypothetical protein n=1 Tax=Halobacillus sp. Nhm2S1 TaxID=2866716 RepID=UPI001C736660|nr:hypothetical protein [Halobacillus sp. Nhm2S1]MBX0358958.1 hypothetical protein [Halobacillus sp. Nhm2S1]